MRRLAQVRVALGRRRLVDLVLHLLAPLEVLHRDVLVFVAMVERQELLQSVLLVALDLFLFFVLIVRLH